MGRRRFIFVCVRKYIALWKCFWYNIPKDLILQDLPRLFVPGPNGTIRSWRDGGPVFAAKRMRVLILYPMESRQRAGGFDGAEQRVGYGDSDVRSVERRFSF